MLEIGQHSIAPAAVNHWAFDNATGRLSARDRYGNLVMAVTTGPLFAERLVAAFSSSSMRAPESRPAP
ncbi:hypothetical protein ABIC83_000843 [Roseateles asaccharophilus]|uniref:Uncharacterized protein n=1 Tax=Roseateles asaccharophilus TaxID=582607 RepID=A0ABU2A235_9BURK|nr:hypothetical protein [Roseateles asaccharophilus]